MKLYFLLLAGGGSEGSNPFALITPDPGLFIWTVVVFAILWFLLAKYAFGPITKALRKREENISDSLKAAERARAEVAELRNENEELLKEAKEERTKILREANEIKSKIIAEAKEDAKKEASKILADAKQEIRTQKNVAFAEVKQEVGKIAVEIAEKLMRKELDSSKSHDELVSTLVKEASFNQN